MKKIIALFLFFVLLLSFAACSSHKETMQETEGTAVLSGGEESQESTNDNVNPLPQQTQPAKQPEPTSEPTSKQPETISNPTPAEIVPDTPPREPEPSSEPVAEQPEESKTEESKPEEPKEEEPVKQAQFYMIVGETTFTADFADNSSADTFRELLAQGDLTINMSDYGSFEKVGSIGQSLPREDTQISTTTGDVILYQGKSRRSGRSAAR